MLRFAIQRFQEYNNHLLKKSLQTTSSSHINVTRRMGTRGGHPGRNVSYPDLTNTHNDLHGGLCPSPSF